MEAYAIWCNVHGLHVGRRCPLCPHDAAPLPIDLLDLREIAEQARALREVADWSTELRDLRGRVSALEHRANNVQRAHNTLADDFDAFAAGRCRQHGPWNRTDGLLGCPICGRPDDGRRTDPRAP